MSLVKGEKFGLCNVTHCQSPVEVTWYNHSTQRYYCAECARMLNHYNRKDAMELFGHELCTNTVDTDTVDWSSTLVTEPVTTDDMQSMLYNINPTNSNINKKRHNMSKRKRKMQKVARRLNR